MVEEALNFGMNATQLSQISDLQSQIENLDYSMQDVNDDLRDIQDAQLLALKRQEEIALNQEKELQKKKAILELKNSIFNLKTKMEEIYQSDEISNESKYLEFMNVCNSPMLSQINLDYFENFEDKEYILSVKKYLFQTKDDLFDSLTDNKKNIIQTINNKLNELNRLLEQKIQKPSEPQEPKFDSSKLITLNMPVKPKNYQEPTTEERKKYMENAKYINKGINRVVAVILFVVAFILMALLGNTSLVSDENGIVKDGFLPLFIMLLPIFVFPGGYLLFLFKRIIDYIRKRPYYEYESELKSYHDAEKINKKLEEKFESELQEYKENYEELIQTFQDDLQRYNTHQKHIQTLKNEIAELYQSFLL